MPRWIARIDILFCMTMLIPNVWWWNMLKAEYPHRCPYHKLGPICFYHDNPCWWGHYLNYRHKLHHANFAMKECWDNDLLQNFLDVTKTNIISNVCSNKFHKQFFIWKQKLPLLVISDVYINNDQSHTKLLPFARQLAQGTPPAIKYMTWACIPHS